MGASVSPARRAGTRRAAGKRAASRKSRKRRPGARRRQLVTFLALVAVAGSLITSVNRTARGNRLAESINALRTEEELLRTRLSEELVRVDSLASRERILVAAARLGMRPATDDEVVHLPDVGP